MRLPSLLLVLALTATSARAAPVVNVLPAGGAVRDTVDQLLDAPSWARRAIAAVRLERYDCDESGRLLVGLLDDESWQVRAFATRSLGRRRVPGEPAWFADEPDPRVLRVALRHRYDADLDRLNRGIGVLLERASLEDKLLGIELAAATGDDTLFEPAEDALRTVILRMDRREAGALSPRLSSLTGQPDLRRASRWQRWLRRAGRPLPINGSWSVPVDPGVRPDPSLIAALDEERFFNLADYVAKLADRRVDLVVCMDTTASMWGELAEAQGELDDMMVFAADVVRALRVGIVAYRDKRDRYEVTGWDLTPDVATARARLWQLSADGGGDRPESVRLAMHRAYAEMSWDERATKVLVLIGDAPPHVGEGGRCVELARIARDGLDLITHAIQAEAKPVDHFPEIAEAGGGRCVDLQDGDSLVAEIAGLTLGERFGREFRDFFAIYQELCR